MRSTSNSGRTNGQTRQLADLWLATVLLGAWLIVDASSLTAAATPSGNSSRPETVTPFNFSTADFEVLDDSSNSSDSTSDDSAARGWLLDELQLVKVVVLCVVVAILLLSTCTFIFRTFSVFDSKKDEH